MAAYLKDCENDNKDLMAQNIVRQKEMKSKTHPVSKNSIKEF